MVGMTSTDVASEAPPEAGAERPVWTPGFFAALLAGIVSVGLAIGLAELLAALGVRLHLMHAAASPINALGSAFINLTPEWLKEFAIRTFGQHDKDALRIGMGLTLVLVAALVGLLARRSPRLGVSLTGLLLVVTLVAIWTRTPSGVLDGLPIVVGGIAGLVLLVLLFRRTVLPTPLPMEPISRRQPRVGGSTSTGADRRRALEADPAEKVGGEPRSADNRLGRRNFFRVAGLGVVIAATAGAVSRWIPGAADVAASRARLSVPNAPDKQAIPSGSDLHVPEQPPFLTPNADFYRVDTAFTLPNLTAEEYSLRIHGMVDKEISLDYSDLVARPQVERTITLTCVSNEVGGDLAGNATWVGARIADLLKEAGPQSGADCVLCTSVDGFTSSTPLDALTDGRDALLAVAMNGEILPQAHGFPVRMIVPGLYGYVSACKWVIDLEVTQFSKVNAYWTQRGWSNHAPIKTASRIDVPKGFVQVKAGDKVTLAGVAWAQHRGIAKVEVQIGDGPWLPTTLSESFSNDTWVQWRHDWTAVSGLQTVRCRATDKTGAVQDATQRPIMPDGSTGLDSRTLTVS